MIPHLEMWMTFTKVIILINTVRAYSIDYYNCQDPKHITTYKLSEACVKDQKRGTGTSIYALLQEREIQDLQGYSCQVKRTTITEYCGSFSHNKLAKAPEVEIIEPMTPDQCLNLIHTQKYTTPDGKVNRITLGTENVIYSNDRGAIIISDNQVSCRGQSMRFGHHIVNEVIQVSQYKVIIREEKFIVKNQQVEAASEHLMLPDSCRVMNVGCQTIDKTFTWFQPPEHCSLEKIRVVNMNHENGYLIDETHKILLNATQKVPSPRGCPVTTIFATEYSNLYLATKQNGWPTMSKFNSDLDIASYVRSRDDYLTFQLEKKIEDQDHQLKEQICNRALEHHQGEVIHLQDDIFIKRNGDCAEYVQCRKAIGQLVEKEKCYEDIPITNGFVKVHNRLFTSHSATKPCNKIFGLKLYTNEKVWIEISPHLKQMKEPKQLPLLDHSFHHEDLSTGGIYTEGELTSWREHLELGDYQNAITKSISYGVCIHQGTCQDTGLSPLYDLEQLSPMSWNPTLNMWDKLNSFIQKHATYICLIALVIEATKIIILCVCLVQTMLQDGIPGAQALTYLVCCTAKHHAEKIAKRSQRLRQRQESEEIPLSPVAEERVEDISK